MLHSLSIPLIDFEEKGTLIYSFEKFVWGPHSPLALAWESSGHDDGSITNDTRPITKNIVFCSSFRAVLFEDEF